MEKVGIEIELMGGEEAFALLQRIDSKIDTLNRKKKFNSLSGLNSAKRELEGYINTLEKYEKELGDLERKANEAKKAMSNWGSAFENSAASKFAKQNIQAYEDAKRKIAEAQAGIRRMESEMDTATTKARTLRQVFNSWSSQIAHVGGAMQSFGNALTRVGSFMRPITSGLLLGAGYKALNLFTEGFSNAFERADTMKNYDRTLKALGLDVTKTFSIAGKEAKTAKENLDDAVQGLPTSLDEIMAAQKVYAGATGEMVESTKTAIAANNTFLASGMGSREQRFMQKYLVALASGADLTTTQWQSMARIAPLAMRAVSKELGYAGDEYAQFTKDVQKGTISGEEFLKAFQKVGVSGAIADAARAQTESWNGLFSNIRIAVTRMGANVLDTLNQTFKDATGRTLLQRLLGWDAEGKDLQDGVKSWINDISESVQNWIKANPDRIIEFFENLKAIDIKGFLKGMAQGMGDLLGIIERFAKIASNKDMSKLGRFLAKAGFYGRAFTIIGGVIKGMRHPLAAIGTAGSWLFKGRKAGGLFGKIAELFGKKQDIETAGEVGGAIGKATPNLISAFKNMALISGIIAMPAFTAWGVTAGVKNSIKNFKETIDLLKDIKWADAKKVLLGIGGFLGVSAILGGIVGNVPGAVGVGTGVAIGETVIGVIMSIATGFADLNMALIKGSIKKFVESVKLLGEIPDVSSFGDVKTKISNAITMLNEISTLFQGRYVDMGVKEGGIQGAGLFTSFSINSITKSLAGLKKAVKAVQDLANVSIPEGAADNIKRAVDAVSEASSNMWKLWGLGYGSVKNNTDNITKSLTNLKKIINQINGLKGVKVKKGGITAVKNAITNIGNAFDATAIGDIRVKITAFVAAIQDAFTMFDKLNKPIEIKTTVKLSKDFKSSVDEVVKQINSARGRIRRAWNAIPDSLSKTITLTVNGKVNASGALNGISKGVGSNVNKLVEKGNSILDKYQANGGLIYRAHGGGVPFKRRGTDTVPAMLTPGEYVHNKRAVNTFGIDFMRKVNNLDMKGAMNELMHRAGHMANINRGTNITNNNYNNQKVVINNSNAGAGYTFRTASRFVGAF